jgi:hypothetical protein
MLGEDRSLTRSEEQRPKRWHRQESERCQNRSRAHLRADKQAESVTLHSPSVFFSGATRLVRVKRVHFLRGRPVAALRCAANRPVCAHPPCRSCCAPLQGIAARIADQNLLHLRLQQIVQPGRPGSFFPGHMWRCQSELAMATLRIAHCSCGPGPLRGVGGDHPGPRRAAKRADPLPEVS